jgi:hypothetical protein
MAEGFREFSRLLPQNEILEIEIFGQLLAHVPMSSIIVNGSRVEVAVDLFRTLFERQGIIQRTPDCRQNHR